MVKKFSTIYLFMFMFMQGLESVCAGTEREAEIHPGQVIRPSQDSFAFLSHLRVM